jgi:hypothetical protein
MSGNGKQYDQDDNFEQRLYQTLAFVERAGDQQRAAAAMLEQLAGLERRLNPSRPAVRKRRYALPAKHAARSTRVHRIGRGSQPGSAHSAGRGSSTSSLSWPPVS